MKTIQTSSMGHPIGRSSQRSLAHDRALPLTENLSGRKSQLAEKPDRNISQRPTHRGIFFGSISLAADNTTIRLKAGLRTVTIY